MNTKWKHSKILKSVILENRQAEVFPSTSQLRASGPVILELTCGRIIAVWKWTEAGERWGFFSLPSSYLSVTHHWPSAPPFLFQEQDGYVHPWSTDLQTQSGGWQSRWVARDVHTGWGWLGSVASIHPFPLQGLSFSSVWLGALSLRHNTMRGPGSTAIFAFHVSI